jgi:hypothetical protein
MRSLRARYPSDTFIVGGDFNVDIHSPQGTDERLVGDIVLCEFGGVMYVCMNV